MASRNDAPHRSALDVFVLLVGAVALSEVLVVALVWTLGLVLG